MTLAGAAVAQCPALPVGASDAQSPVAGLSCAFDPALTRLFTPATVPSGTYRVYVTQLPFDRVVAVFRAAAPARDAVGAWLGEAMDPLDAYGEAGPYDRARVARVYVGVRPHVAHGPIVQQGRTVASITLVSPYPDPTLSRLIAGTLIIEFRIPPTAVR